MKALRPFFLSLPLALLAGCGLLWDDPYVTVTTTPLNWVEIHYYRQNEKGETKRRVNLRVTGLGLVEVKTGTSKLVSDDFAKTYADASWGDIREQRYYVDPDHVRELFQGLVNAGLFDKDRTARPDKNASPPVFIAVRAAIDNKTYTGVKNLYEEDPELAELLHSMILEFNRVQLGAKR